MIYSFQVPFFGCNTPCFPSAIVFPRWGWFSDDHMLRKRKAVMEICKKSHSLDNTWQWGLRHYRPHRVVMFGRFAPRNMILSHRIREGESTVKME